MSTAVEPTEYTITGVPMPTGRELLKKLLAIGGEIGHVGKDAQNPHHKYMYASEKAIKEAVYPRFRLHGVFFSLEVQGVPFEMGNALMVPFRYRFIDVESGEEFSGPWLGTGRLGDDKGLYIAITGAIKYALTTHCGIVTGDDPEAEDDRPVVYPTGPAFEPDRGPKPTLPITSAEFKNFNGTCDNCGEATPPDVRTIPSKFENFRSGLKIGDPVYRCEECGKWIPAR